MPLYVKNAEADRLADQLAAVKGVTKTEAVRHAPVEAFDRSAGSDEHSRNVREVVRIVDDLHAKAGPSRQPADKAWIDTLYEDD